MYIFALWNIFLRELLFSVENVWDLNLLSGLHVLMETRVENLKPYDVRNC